MDIPSLPTIWFIIIAVLWTGYLLLEGFDLGVGMHMRLLARNDRERRVLLNTIGPVWDGNEVWLITAGGATFAAFPFWYASLFSALYIPLVLVLAALIFRAVSIEYRGKGDSDRWRTTWDWVMAGGSFVAAFGVGAMLSLTTTGLPLDANGDRVGGAFAWLNCHAVVGGFAVVGFALVHAGAFLALKTDGAVRQRARRFVVTFAPVLLVPIVIWVFAVLATDGNRYTWPLIAVAAIAASAAWLRMRAGHEGQAFAGMAIFLIAGAAAIFGSVYPVVLPSTLNPAWNLTIDSASSSPYTLKLMSIIAAFGVPLVLVYQGWTYWVFRQRISEHHIPDAHTVPVAVAPPSPTPTIRTHTQAGQPL